MKRLILPLLLLFFGYVGVASAETNHTWHATYWNNTELAGAPVLERDEPFLYYRWNRGSPAPGVVNNDEFSARWTRTLSFSEGTWNFTVSVDDGVRVFIDGQMIIDGWRLDSFNTLSNAIYLTEGEHEVVVEYFENSAEAVMQFSWDKVLDATSGTENPAPPVVSGTWTGEYFNNTVLRDPPALVREDAAIDFDWGTGSPDPLIQEDFFSVRWTNEITFAPGRYRFNIVSDDGARLDVNGKRIINSWGNHPWPGGNGEPERELTAELTITDGTVPIVLEYHENNGEAKVSLVWTLLYPIGNDSPGEVSDPVTAKAIVIENAPLRDSFGFDSPVREVISANTEVQLAGQRSADGVWIHVIAPSGRWGWVEARVLDTDFPLETLDVWK